MPDSFGFAPVASFEASILILGSLPGEASLRLRQYYGLPQNGFWKIMGRLFGASLDLSYEDRLEKLLQNGLALWDVCASASREGSLDSSIVNPVVNDFVRFFQKHPKIVRVCFNGKYASRLYRRRVLPSLPPLFAALELIDLPSTSPANASVSFEHKLESWKEALSL